MDILIKEIENVAQQFLQNENGFARTLQENFFFL
jgi:hypothetical protein